MRLRADRDGARTPRVIWLITALFGCLLLLYSILFPSYRGPDEPQHVDLVLHVQETWRYPEFDDRFIAQSIIDTLDVVSFHSRSRDLKAGDAPLRSSRPPLMALTPGSSQRNHLTQHPPLYYYTLAVISEAVDIFTPGGALSRPFDMTVWTLRLFNLLLFLPLPAIAYRIVREMGGNPEIGVAAVLMLLAVPQLTHIGAVVNNDNLLVLLTAVLTLLLLRVARGDLSSRMAVGTGVVGGLALLTKASAAFIPAWIAVAYLLGGRRTALGRSAARRFGMATGLALVVGGWWWVRNWLAYGGVLVGIRQLPPASGDFAPDVLWWLRRFVTWIVERWWGWFGWFDVRLPLWAVAMATAVVVGGVIAAVMVRRRRADVMLLLLPTVAIGGLVMAGAFRGYLVTGVTQAIQGRYLFPGIVGVVVVAAAGLGRVVRRPEALVVSVIGFAALMQSTAVITALHFYWAPPGAGSLTGEARSMVAWSPWPGELVVALGVTAVLLAGWLGYEVFRLERWNSYATILLTDAKSDAGNA